MKPVADENSVNGSSLNSCQNFDRNQAVTERGDPSPSSVYLRPKRADPPCK
jgi:hypothetical protein